MGAGEGGSFREAMYLRVGVQVLVESRVVAVQSCWAEEEEEEEEEGVGSHS